MNAINGNVLDGARFRRARRRQARAPQAPGTRMVPTPHARVRTRDTGGDGPVVVMVPDGPCVLEHHEALLAASRASTLRTDP